ncbi:MULTISPECIES: hypothetical protein [unclassified Luteimonas]|uniref:hypothetical protein n=1 Tax=unclassified Luteimonas TaxID=2629088 RepID=UPI0018F0DB80|nr:MULTISPECIES: hypothetical protein [unclassified Luteimonas]MBJ6979383.1 hypothetical protein [Luteimonas sp. MC1895]MBJ6984402.1 hypothetical protein [Luteimonas sp. MC1750]QQO04979.1 hypothetical protein JGR68_08810 [Luteimonas sp. MC1750]
MNARFPLSLLAAACLLLALGACDRRVTDAPDESRAADTEIQPAGTAGDASRPADSANPDARCAGLQEQALRDCMEGVDSAREASDLRQ